MLNLELNQEMERKEAGPSHQENRAQHGAIRLVQLELIALKRVSQSSWAPQVRLITPPRPLLRCPSPTATSIVRERVEPLHQEPEVSHGDTRELPKAPRRSSRPRRARSAKEAAQDKAPGTTWTRLSFWKKFVTRVRKALTKSGTNK